jgi:hypothetical protein
MKYKIIRFHKNSGEQKIIDGDLSLSEAQEWCRDAESSSTTCEDDAGKEYTAQHGPWFDGYEEE